MIEQFRAIQRLLCVGRVMLSANFTRIRRNPVDRALWQQRQSKRFLNALKIEVRSIGELPKEGLLVCNHLSYLDIIAIASLGPVVFVAKSDLAGWPLIGNLLRKSGTILAYRNHPIKSAQTALEIESALSNGLTVVLFPEGTSSNGESVFPFRSPFFQPAHKTASLVTPAALKYTSESGDPQEDICYWGEHMFASHLMKLTTLQKITAHLNFGEAQPCLANRKESAVYFHREVSALHAALKDRFSDLSEGIVKSV